MGHRIVRISSAVLAEFLKGRAHPCDSNTPVDVEVVRALPPANEHGTVELVCRSREWPEVIEGGQIPLFEPALKRLTKTRADAARHIAEAVCAGGRFYSVEQLVDALLVLAEPEKGT